MDWQLVFSDFVEAVRDRKPMPIDVYDMAAWMSISTLAEESILSRKSADGNSGLHKWSLDGTKISNILSFFSGGTCSDIEHVPDCRHRYYRIYRLLIVNLFYSKFGEV